MKFERGKLFTRYCNKKTKYVINSYRYNNLSYYKYLRNQSKNGYYQIPLTSNSIILLMKNLIYKYGYIINNIQFMQDDENFKEDVDNLINNNKNKNNIKYLQKILDKLSILDTENSIEIKNIELINQNKRSKLSLKNNGIIVIDKKNYNNMSYKMLSILNEQ